MAAATPSTSGSRILRPRHRPDRGDGGHHRADCARSDCWPAPCFGGHHDTPTIERLAIRLPTDGGLLGHLINSAINALLRRLPPELAGRSDVLTPGQQLTGSNERLGIHEQHWRFSARR